MSLSSALVPVISLFSAQGEKRGLESVVLPRRASSAATQRHLFSRSPFLLPFGAADVFLGAQYSVHVYAVMKREKRKRKKGSVAVHGNLQRCTSKRSLHDLLRRHPHLALLAPRQRPPLPNPLPFLSL